MVDVFASLDGLVPTTCHRLWSVGWQKMDYNYKARHRVIGIYGGGSQVSTVVGYTFTESHRNGPYNWSSHRSQLQHPITNSTSHTLSLFFSRIGSAHLCPLEKGL